MVPRIQNTGGSWAQPIVATVWAVGLAVYVARRRRGPGDRLLAMLLGLLASCLLALTLSAVQVLPVLEHVAASVRWEGAGLEDVYDSSLLPYRIVEWLWPNVFGTFTAGNHYWMPLLPPVGGARPSPMSLYFGSAPDGAGAGHSRVPQRSCLAVLDDGESPC